MDKKYNKIVMLVHPFFDLLLVKLAHFNDHDTRPDVDIPKSVSKPLAKLFREYGKAIIEHSKDPNVKFLLILPVDFSPKRDIYSKIVERFVKFAKEKFKDRIVVTDFDFYLKFERGIFPHKKFLKDLAKKLEIEVFGEYGDNCVKAWKSSLKTYLEHFKFEVTKTNINYHLSIINPKDKTLLARKILVGAERRKMQQKRKKEKLKIRRK
jgi:hypothetical protein